MSSSLEWSAQTRKQDEYLPLRGAACVVEPDEGARAEMAALLRAMGYTTHETGSPAVGAFIAEHIDLHAAVVNMAAPDGLKLIRRMRARSPKAAVIALSAQTRAGLAGIVARLVGAIVLPAPVSCEAVGAALRAAEERRR